ncbi:hypothetical protein HWV62_30282 [Athelia sp. TMB]|nr:hypothetical protein HWV62_30282 [Athelia sp. TMB]
MAPAEKIQGNEKLYLDSKFASYLAHAAAGTHYVFWPELFRDYLKLYPAPPLPMPVLTEGAETEVPEEEAEQDVDTDIDVGETVTINQKGVERAARWQKTLNKLRAMTEEQQNKWCQGQGITRKKGQTRLTHATGSRAPMASIISLFAVSSKTRPLTQVKKYSKLFFPTRVRSLVAEALVEFGDNPSRAQTLTTIRRVTTEMWEAEDDATRDIVLAAMAVDKAKREASLQAFSEEDDAQTPLQYQSAIDLLPPLLKMIFDELSKTTGWAFTVLMGGPVPQADGNITSATHHVGQSLSGNNWGRAYPDFDKAIINPYQEFLRHIFPSDVRHERALTTLSATKEQSTAPDMLPFHEEDLGLGQDDAGDDFMLNLFEHAPSEPVTAVSPSTSGIPFNTHGIPIEPTVALDYVVSTSSLHLMSSRPTSPTVPAPIAELPPPSPVHALPELPATVPANDISHPPPAAPVARPKPKPVNRSTSSVTVISTASTVQSQSASAKDRYALLKAGADDNAARRKERMRKQHAQEDREDQQQAELAAADLAEILALKSVTPAEERASVAAEKEKNKEIVTASMAVFEVETEKKLAAAREKAAEEKDDAMARLVRSRNIKAVHALEKAAAASRSQSVLESDTQLPDEGSDSAPIPLLTSVAATTRSSIPPSTSPPEASNAGVSPEPEAMDTTGLEHHPESPAPQVLTASQKNTAKRKLKAAEKASRREQDLQVRQKAQADKEAVYVTKMAKRNASQLITNPFSVPDDAQPWLRPLIDYLAHGDLGGEWCACIKAYVKLQENMGCVEMSHSLSTKHRPAEIGAWISRARKLEKTPPVAKTYLAEWMSWWCGLQPEWRQGTGLLPPALYVCDSGEWGALRNCGKNGVALILLAAAWYARQFGAQPEWVTAVTDVRRTLEGMVEGDAGTGDKRATSAIDPSSPIRPRKRVSAENNYHKMTGKMTWKNVLAK